jgi:hypothetical protein
MIEPYATVLNSFANRFQDIGLLKTIESDYSTTFSDGINSIEISTEKYYHPSITTRFTDRAGRTYSIRIIREALAPEQLEKNSNQLISIKKQYKLDDIDIDRDLHERGVAAYCALAVDQLLDFVASYKEKLFSENDYFRGEYSTLEKSAMIKLGLRS